ncbi:MAG: DUF2804 domain-containing protein [Bacillota bacterium]
MKTEPELMEPVLLCIPGGRLNPGAVGWSRRPLHRCNLTGHWLRKKRWNYWAITTETHLFSLTVSDLDYAGLGFAYFLDFETREFTEQTVLHPFGRGLTLPEDVEGEVRFDDRRLRLYMRDDGTTIRLIAESPDFGGVPLKADFTVTRPPGQESVNVVIPWSRNRFQFTSKQEALPARGEVRLGERRIAFDGFACLDFGRGVWPYRAFWNWAAASGVQGGRTIGLNLGGGWTDGTGMNENGIVVDGRVTKIHDDLRFDYDPSNFMRPWRIRTRETDQVDLLFEPFFERVARTDALVVRSEVHQMIGRFTGTVVTEAGERIAIERMVGWAEEHRARW